MLPQGNLPQTRRRVQCGGRGDTESYFKPTEIVSAETNYYRSRITTGEVTMYSMSYRPELPAEHMHVRGLVLNKNRPAVLQAFEATEFLSAGGQIYVCGGSGASTRIISLPYNDVEYEVEFSKIGTVSAFDEADTTRNIMRETFFNIILRRAMESSDFCVEGRFLYDMTPLNVPGVSDSSVFRGYFMRVSLMESGLAVNIDLKHRLLQTKNCLQLIRSENFNRATCSDRLTRAMVVTDLQGSTGISASRVYRIEAVEWDMSLDSTFTKNGQEISFKDYYKTTYGVDLQDKQPLLKCDIKKKRTVYIPAELARLTGFTGMDSRSQDQCRMPVSKITRIPMSERFGHCTNLLTKLVQSQAAREVMNRWGVTIENTPLHVRAVAPASNHFHVITDPNHFQNVSGAPIINPERSDFNHHATGSKINFQYVANPLGAPKFATQWAILRIAKRPDQTGARNTLISLLQKEIQRNHTNVTAAPVIMPDLIVAHDRDVSKFISHLQATLAGAPQLLIILTDRKDSTIYNHVKQECMKINCLTQVVREDTLSKSAAVSMMFNQVIAKLGGHSHVVDTCLKDIPTMVVGIDCITIRSTKVASFVATTNSFYTSTCNNSFPMTDALSAGGELDKFMRQAIPMFEAANGVRPQRFIIYRDGVSAGSRRAVVEREIPSFERVLEEIYGTAAPSLQTCYVLVNKQVSSRFATRGADGVLKNPRALSIFREGVVDIDEYNFYCVHQEVNKSACVTPTSYSVLYTRNMLEGGQNVTAGQLELFTLQLSTNYHNWPGPVRTPNVVMHARKLGQLYSQCLLNYEASPTFLTRPHYL